MYTLTHFIQKFESFPAWKWGESITEHCALAQCGIDESYTETEEAVALIKLFGGKDWSDRELVMNVNDGITCEGKNAKERVLKKLKSLNV